MIRRFLTIFVALTVVLAVSSDSWGRAGRGENSDSGLGSRGSRTFDRPMDRTVTPPPSPRPSSPTPTQQPMYIPRANTSPPPASPGSQQPGVASNNPTTAGLPGGMLGGLLGSGLGSMLSGSSTANAANAEAAPGSDTMGFLVRIALLAGLIWIGLRLFRRWKARQQQPQTPPSPRAFPPPLPEEKHPSRQEFDSPAPLDEGFGAAAPRRIEKEFEVAAEDKHAFSEILLGVQSAWSEGNLIGLRRYATPEVVGWMSEDLSRDRSRGIQNIIEEVTLLKGDVSESWREEHLEYVTALVVFSAKDYTVNVENNNVIEGDPDRLVEIAEAWTFVRSGTGKWLLSAIEQV